MIDLGMYCLCFVGREPKKIQYDQQNIMCGAVNYDHTDYATLQNRGFIMDNIGESISHMNNDFGSLTGLYWVWKNAQHEYKGTNTYRIYWDEEFNLKPNRVYVPEAKDIVTAIKGYAPHVDNVYDHFSHCHNNLGWQLLYGLAGDRRIPITIDMINGLRNYKYLIPFHMFAADVNTFNRICEVLFTILFEFHANYAGFLPEIYNRNQQVRFYDFFGERILHLILTNNYHFLGNVDVAHLNILDIDHYA
jgi:hypothetical protein